MSTSCPSNRGRRNPILEIPDTLINQIHEREEKRRESACVTLPSLFVVIVCPNKDGFVWKIRTKTAVKTYSFIRHNNACSLKSLQANAYRR